VGAAASKSVWAREIPGTDLGPLFAYLRNRDVRLYEPDEDDEGVTPNKINGEKDR
jgi:hypothetical protein